MTKSADQFLNDLEREALVKGEIVASLRRQAATAAQGVTSAAIAKLLVDKGHLSAAQAQKLLGAAAASDKPQAAKAAPAKPQPARPTPATPVIDDGDLAPLGSLDPLADLPPLDGLAPLDSLTPLDPLAAPLAVQPQAAATSAAPHPVAASPAPAKQPPAPVQPARRKSSLGLVLGGFLIVLVLCGAAGGAWFLIPRGGGNDGFDLAERDYEAREYEAAIAKYDALLASDPRSSNAAAARAHRAMARLLAARAASPKSWTPVLAVAKEDLPPIAAARELSQLHSELAPMLMDMAADLATQAQQNGTTDEQLAQARDALALANDARFVPGTLRQWQRLALAEETLARLKYDAERPKALAAALAAIKQAADASDLAAAFAEFDKLHSAHPELAAEPQLRDAGPLLAAAAGSKVAVGPYTTKAERSEPPTAIVGSVTLFRGSQPAPAAKPGPPAWICVAGSVWTLDSATGRLLWRRPASACSSAPGDDLLLVDSTRREIQRVAAATGAVAWRHPLAAPCAQLPVVVGDSIVVTTRAGQIIALDARTGDGQDAAQLPQPCRVASAVDPAGKLLYQVADHSLVYALSVADLKCQRAAFVGHALAGVMVPPATLPQHLVVAENRGENSAVLHVLPLEASGLPLPARHHIEIAGQVIAPLVALDGRLLALTDQGRVHVFSSAAKPEDGLKQMAASDAGRQDSLVRYGVAQAGKLLVAGQGLRQFSFPAADNLREDWSALSDEVLLGPPQAVGDVIIVARQAADRSALVVAAIPAAGGKPLWETRLAEPLAAVVPTDSDGHVAAISTAGAVTRLTLAEINAPLVRELTAPQTAAGSTPPIAGAVSLAGGANLLVPAGQPSQLLVLDAGSISPRPIALPGELAGPPIAWRAGLAAACASGALAWLDAKTGAPLADPLQLGLRPGERLAQCRLAAAGESGNELLVVDGRSTLYHVVLATDPTLHLVASAVATLPSPPASGLAGDDKLVGLVDRRGQWHSFALPDLSLANSLDLSAGDILTGPARCAGAFVLSTDRDEFVCLDAAFKLLWKVPLPHGPLAGEPAADDAGIVVASRSGWLCRVASDNGRELTSVDLGQPLALGPVLAGPLALVATSDGTLVKVALPTQQVAQP